MGVKIENIEKNTIQMDFEVEAQIFEKGLERAFFMNVKKFNIPGFRKGKAPRQIVERYYGAEVLFEDAANIVCSEAYKEAIKENNIHPVDEPKIDVKQIEKGKDFIFTAKVTVKPEVNLSQYKGVKVQKVNTVITDKEVEDELAKVAEKNARMVTVEDREVKEKDTVNIDFEGFIDEVPFDGGKASNHNLQVGSGSFINGFEEQLIGTKIGDEIEVKVTFPDDYHESSLAGKPAIFKVKINKITEKQLPEIDDEFAKDVSEFDTLPEYKNYLMNKLQTDAETRDKQQLEEDVIEKIYTDTEIDIPEVMIEKEIDRSIYDFDWSLKQQGIELEKYLDFMKVDYNDFRKDFKDKAQRQVKTKLILEKIKDLEGIIASDEEVEEKIQDYAKRYNESIDEFRKIINEEFIENIKNSITYKKTIDMLVENAEIE